MRICRVKICQSLTSNQIFIITGLHNIAQKRVTGGGAHLRGFAPLGNTITKNIAKVAILCPLCPARELNPRPVELITIQVTID